MQRDDDFIRTLLMHIEENEEEHAWLVVEHERFCHEKEEFLYHCRLIVERGLAKGLYVDKGTYQFDSLTWEGQDFLDNARNPNVWKPVCTACFGLSFSVFQKALEAAATQYALKTLGMGPTCKDSLQVRS